MNYRIETTTIAGLGRAAFYAMPYFSNEEKVLLGEIGVSLLKDKKGDGLTNNYYATFLSNVNEIMIYSDVEDVNINYAHNLAEKLVKDLKEHLEKILDAITIIPFAVKVLQHDGFKVYGFNTKFIQIPAITTMRKQIDDIRTSMVSTKEYSVMDSFIIPTVKDLNEIQVKLKEDVIDLQSNLSKVAANLERTISSYHELNKNQDNVNYFLGTRIDAYDDWVEKTLKPKLEQIDVLHTRISQLELRVFKLETPWYKKLWNKLTIFWSEM